MSIGLTPGQEVSMVQLMSTGSFLVVIYLGIKLFT